MENRLQTGAEKKRTNGITLVQTITCFVLLLVICVMSFGTIFSVGIDMDEDTLAERWDDLADGLDLDSDVEFDSKIDVDFVFMIKSAISIGDVIGAVSQTSKDAMEHSDDLDDSAEDLAEKMSEQDFVNFLVLVLLIAVSFSGNLLLGIGNVFLLVTAVALPLVSIIAALRALIAVLSNTKDIGNAFHKVSKAFVSVIAQFPMVLMVLLLAPDVQLGTPVYIIMACCVGGLVVNFIGSRMKQYSPQDGRYLNLLQIVSLAALVGYLVFFFTVMKSGLIGSASASLRSATKGDFIEAIDDGEFGYAAFFLNIFLIVAVFAIVGNLTNILTRMVCMSKRRSDRNVGTGVLALLIVVLPFVMQAVEDMDFKLDEDSMTTFILTCLGLVIMAVAEFCLAGMPKSVCPEVTANRRQEIVTGAYLGLDAEQPVPVAPVVAVPVMAVPVVTTVPVVAVPVAAAPAPAQPAKVPCPHCGGLVEVGMKFCRHCGKPVTVEAAPQPAKPTCPHCGGLVEAGMKFCRHCGKPMTAEAAPQPAEPTCPHCGGIEEAGMKFCRHCGKPMTAETAPVVQEPVVEEVPVAEQETVVAISEESTEA